MFKQLIQNRVTYILDAIFTISDMVKRHEYPERFKVAVDENYELFRTTRSWVLIRKDNSRREITIGSRCDLSRLIQAYLSEYDI